MLNAYMHSNKEYEYVQQKNIVMNQSPFKQIFCRAPAACSATLESALC